MDYINFLTATFESIGGFGYWLAFLIAFAESFAFVGTLIPGSILIYLVGFMSSRGYLDIVTLIWFTTAGAILGDGLSYFLGTKGKSFFHNENRFLKLSHLERGEEFFRKHGPKSVFLGRFVGPLRPIIPFIAGLSRMNKKIFFLWNISSAFLWSVSHLLVGYFFGGAIDIIEAWTTRAGLLIVSIVGGLALLWLILKVSGPFFGFLKSFYASFKNRFVSSRITVNFAQKNPALVEFVSGRFSSERFSGLPLSLISVGFVYVLFLFFGSVQNALSSSAIALSDKRVADLLFSFRDLELAGFFTWVILLAKWQIVVALAVAATLIMRLWRKEFYIPALWATVAAAELFNYLGGVAFYRHGPESSFYFKTTSSFPSSYSVMAAAFYGFIVYVLARHSKNWGRKTNIIFLGAAIIFGIGFSSLYLGESFLSDVWGGYLLGILCLLIGISFAEFLKSREKIETALPMQAGAPDANAKILSLILLAASFVFYANFSERYHPALGVVSASQVSVKVADAVNIFENSGIPRITEKLFGDGAQPVNFIIIAKDDNGLIDAMKQSGWLLADRTDVGTILRLVRAEFFNQNYEEAPMAPSFWNAAVNNLGFEKPTATFDAYSRHHLRIWKTNFETQEGKIYVGTVRLDTVKWIVVHKSNPDMDAERELLFSDLNAAGEIVESKKLQFTEPLAASKDLSETPFFTDGKLYEVILK